MFRGKTVPEIFADWVGLLVKEQTKLYVPPTVSVRTSGDVAVLEVRGVYVGGTSSGQATVKAVLEAKAATGAALVKSEVKAAYGLDDLYVTALSGIVLTEEAKGLCHSQDSLEAYSASLVVSLLLGLVVGLCTYNRSLSFSHLVRFLSELTSRYACNAVIQSVEVHKFTFFD